jgi:proton glutamate symport protein
LLTAFAVAGLLLLFLGIATPALLRTQPWNAAVRWAGLICLVPRAVRRKSLTLWIIVAMLVGAEVGFDHPGVAEHLRFLSDIFLRLIKVIVAPLILGALISGIAGHGNLRSLGRMGIKTFIYFELVTTAALFIGVAAIDVSHAGTGLTVSQSSSAVSAAPETLQWDEFLVHAFPENIAKSIAEGQILQVAVFAVLFGIALSQVPEAERAPLLSFCKSLTSAMFFVTNIVMYFAPIGVGAAMAYTVAHMGSGALAPLVWLLVTAYLAFAVFTLAVMLPVALWARLDLRRFVRAIAEPVTIAFATSTSEAALPAAMEEMEIFGVPREIVAFVIPAGYSFNMDGSTLYLALASIFVAQAAGIHMSWTSQLFMVFTLTLSSKGVAGVPRAVLVILIATAATFHLPSEPIFLILGIDALIDMGRTALNVLGNCLASAVIARWEDALAAESPKSAA